DPDSQVFNYPNGKVVHFITTCFLAEITGGELKCNSDESLEIKFFGRDNLPEDLLTMHPQWLEDALSKKEASFICRRILENRALFLKKICACSGIGCDC